MTEYRVSGIPVIELTPGVSIDGAAIQDDTILDASPDWGTGTNQISAADLPIADAGAYYAGAEVETALLENSYGSNALLHGDEDGRRPSWRGSGGG